jgi:hypothetical protein
MLDGHPERRPDHEHATLASAISSAGGAHTDSVRADCKPRLPPPKHICSVRRLGGGRPKTPRQTNLKRKQFKTPRLGRNIEVGSSEKNLERLKDGFRRCQKVVTVKFTVIRPYVQTLSQKIQKFQKMRPEADE